MAAGPEHAVLMRACAIFIAAALMAWPWAVAADAPPSRVVSINLCTDQMALLLAAPGQLVSVSHLAVDPVSSQVADLVGDLPLNHGQAEEVALMRPDLVLAGRYTAQETVRMLERLGYRVESFAPETSLADIRANLRQMGAVLGQGARAEALIAEMDTTVARLDGLPPSDKVAALYYSGGFTEGGASLGHEILTQAGLRNLTAEMGLPYGGVLGIEEVLLHQPDIIVRGQAFAGYSRAEAMLSHPVLAAYIAASGVSVGTSPAWTCGTPRVAQEILDLARSLRGGS